MFLLLLYTKFLYYIFTAGEKIGNYIIIIFLVLVQFVTAKQQSLINYEHQ